MLTGIKSNLSSEYIQRIYTDVRRSGHISVRRREHLAFVAWKIPVWGGETQIEASNVSAGWFDSRWETRKGDCSSSRGMMPRRTWHSGKKEKEEEEAKKYIANLIWRHWKLRALRFHVLLDFYKLYTGYLVFLSHTLLMTNFLIIFVNVFLEITICHNFSIFRIFTKKTSCFINISVAVKIGYFVQ